MGSSDINLLWPDEDGEYKNRRAKSSDQQWKERLVLNYSPLQHGLGLLPSCLILHGFLSTDILQGNFKPDFYLKYIQKDLRLAIALGDSVNHPTPMAAAANEVRVVQCSDVFFSIYSTVPFVNWRHKSKNYVISKTREQ